MEKRESKRVPFSLNAEVTACGNTYPVSIENISGHGMHMIAPSPGVIEEFIPGSTLSINITSPEGKRISHQANIKWMRIETEPLIGLIYNLGVRIITPAQSHKDMYNGLL
ncbi:MAG: PilZ domain-containing protein [Nitrospirae bacterium]|nr:PilZ domain-containing protein [Nitrospirota bacterium]